VDRKRKPADQEPGTDKPLGRDERVSFYPMKGEDVLRKLLRTPPPGRIRDKDGRAEDAEGKD
jgi:hypothetical protein